MTDPRLARLADVLIHYSLKVRPGQLVRVSGPALAAPLIAEAYRTALEAGAHVHTRVNVDGLDELFFKKATDEQLRFVSPLLEYEVERIDAELGIWAHYNTRSLTGVDPARQAIRREATRALNRRFLERAAEGALRWCGTQYPTHADAQDAEMSLSEYEEFVFGAGLIDHPDPVAAWEKVQREQERIVRLLETRDELRLTGPDVDLTVRTGGRRWINAAGEHNFPDGEVFTAPLENATAGRVRFSFPAIYSGREVHGITLTFSEGRVVEATAEKGEEFLRAMLDLDAGARVLGEFAFGLNYGIARFTKNILFDEKIGGTVHLAVGAAYPETGGTNTSGLHWDMICDMRAGSEVWADGEVIYRNGSFVV
ncbi:MAG: aminopeptidase [Armatimonadetes bacterium]|nr:aminopeptidase [Armatimonadota bacterium]